MSDERINPGENNNTPGQRLVPVTDKQIVPRPVADALRPYDYPLGPYDDGDDLATTLRYYLNFILKRKWLIGGVAVTSLVLGGLITFMQTPKYTATVRLQIESQSAKIVEGGEVSPTVQDRGTDFLRTQYQLLKSRALAERVAIALKLDQDVSFVKSRGSLVSTVRSALFGGGKQQNTEISQTELKRRATNRVLSNASVKPIPGSRLVDVSFLDSNASRAARIANAFGDSFISANLDKRFEANSYAKTFLEDQIKQLKLRLEESERTMLEFAKQQQIVEVNEQSSIAENNLAAANSALGELVSERIKNEQAWRQLAESDAINLPQLLSNSVIDGLRAKRNELTRDYQEKLETFKPSYPAMVQISNKIAEIDRQLKVEVETIRGSLKAAYESSLSQENEMKKRIEQLRADVLALQGKSVQHNILKREVESNRKLYNDLLQRYKEVDIAGGVGTNNVFVVDPAIVPRVPSEPRIGRALILALVMGVGAGVGIAFLLETLDDRIHAPEDIEQLTRLSTLGVIPKAASADAFLNEINDPQSATAEAYRSLATSLQFSTDTGLPKSIAITSSGPGEGKSSTAVAIARHFATIGMKVLLVDADLRKPSLHIKLNRDNSVGLSNYLTGSVSPPEVIQDTDVSNLALMTSGPLPPSAADLLSGTRMYSLVTVGLEVFDLIVVDAPPMLGLADAQLLSTAVSSTIFVVAAGQARKGMISSALHRLNVSRVTPLGVVLTKFDSKTAGYGYGYGYGYGNEAYTYGGGNLSNENTEPPRIPSARAS